jgi:UPF0755 protein
VQGKEKYIGKSSIKSTYFIFLRKNSMLDMKKRHFWISVLACCLLIFSLFAAWMYRVCGTAMCKGEESVYVYLDEDDDIDSVYAKVEKTGKVADIDNFKQVAEWTKYVESVKTGRYDLGRGLSNWEVVRNLRNGIQTPVMLTIPQVWTLESLAAKLSRKLMTDSASLANTFADSTLHEKYGVKPETMICLFMPNTYEVYWTITPEKLVERMHREYQQYWSEERVAKAKAKGLTPHEVITIASIVDKETMKQEENPIVAGLYLNRLKKGMKLQACPTVKFALKEFGLRRILNRHLQVESPYNTYKYAGLPPGPICLPSMNSIEAVLNATDHDYLYMCAKEDFSGTHNFASTGAEHEANARKYQRALNERGIKK